MLYLKHLFYFVYIYIWMDVFLLTWVQEPIEAKRGVSELLELELKATVNLPIWVWEPNSDYLQKLHI